MWFGRSYRPRRLQVAGAVAFVVGGSLLVGSALWILPAGYLAALKTASILAGFGGPTWWDLMLAITTWGLVVLFVWATRRFARGGTERGDRMSL